MSFEQLLDRLARDDADPEALLRALVADLESSTGAACAVVRGYDAWTSPGWEPKGDVVTTHPVSEEAELRLQGRVAKKARQDLFLAGLVARGALAASTRTLTAILEAALDGIVVIDARGRIELFNRAAERMFGYEAAELLGKKVNVLMDEDHASAHDGYMERYIETGERRIIGIGREVVARKKDGTLFPIELGVTEHWIRSERKFTGFVRDLTARKALEDQLRQSQKLEAVGTLAAGVAHDFNNILMGIKGCMKIAAERMPERSSARVFLLEAQAAAERGSKLTRQLLDFARRTPTEHKHFSLNETVVGAEAMLMRLVHHDVELVTTLGAKRDLVMGDPGQIEQVIVNLVVNARDAMEGEGGRIELRTSNVMRRGKTDGRRGPYVRLSVRDEGCGMDAVTMERIYEPFFTTKPPDKGTGLGLATVYGIVEEHGGFIDVKSTVGEGTLFEIDFPRIDPTGTSESA